MDISDVRIKLVDDSSDRLKAFCSVTLDGEFVIRDIKIVEGSNGLFVAMPSRKLSAPCPKCRHKNPLRARHCSDCGAGLPHHEVEVDDAGRAKLYRDIAHPITATFREKLQARVVEAFEAVLEEVGESDFDEAEGTEYLEEADFDSDDLDDDSDEDDDEDDDEQDDESDEEEEDDDDLDDDDSVPDDGGAYDDIIAHLRSSGRPQRRGDGREDRGRRETPPPEQSTAGRGATQRTADVRSADDRPRRKRRRGRGRRGRSDDHARREDEPAVETSVATTEDEGDDQRESQVAVKPAAAKKPRDERPARRPEQRVADRPAERMADRPADKVSLHEEAEVPAASEDASEDTTPFGAGIT